MAERRVGWGGHSGVMRLLAVLGALLLAVSAQPQLTQKVGSDVTLVPQYTGDPSEINWKINSNKLVDMELKPQVVIAFYRHQDRATISENGRLTIKNLTIGDSGNYKAEALVNNVYQNTDITLTVLGCPDQPTITEKSTKDRIVLSCHSSTQGVTYEWQTNRKSVIKNQLYNESRLQEDETFTCFVENGVCKKNVSITISYTPESRSLSGGAITGIVIGVLILILILILIILLLIALCYQYRDNPCVKPIYSFLTSNKESRVKKFKTVHSLLLCKGNEHDEETPEEKPLNPVESCGYITVKFQTEDQPKGIGIPCLTTHNVTPEDHVIEVFQSDGKNHEFKIEEMEGAVIIKLEGDKVTLTVPNTEKVRKVVLKKRGVILFEWTFSSLKLYANNITVEPGSVTVHNMQGGGSYTVEDHSTDNQITNTVNQLEANNQGDESPTYRDVQLAEVGMVPPTGNGRPESKPIGSITFHPSKMTGKDQITWEKDSRPMNTGGSRIKCDPNGDLTIKYVTSEDKGTYTVQCEDKKLDQEFILQL